MFPGFLLRLCACVAALTLAACASLPADRGMGSVNAQLSERGMPGVAVPPAESAPDAGDDPVPPLLARPLSVEDAMQIALLRHPRVRGEYARLGLAQADLYDAVRLVNPRLHASLLGSSTGGQQLGLGLVQSFSDLLLYPARKRFAGAEVERVQGEVAHALFALAAEVQTAYYTHLGATQIARMRALAAESAELSARLAQRYFDAGNVSRLALRLEQAAASEAAITANEATAAALATRHALAASMGLASDATEWSLAGGLPLPAAAEDDPAALQTLAAQHRLDLAAAQREVEQLEDALGVARRYRALGEVEVGVEYERETDRSRLFGPTLSLELPFFNGGAGGVLRAQAQLEQRRVRRDALRLEIGHRVDTAAAAVRAARSRADRYRQALIPQREDIVARLQEQVNFMFAGPFELLRAKREEFAAYDGYLAALRDYWLARSELALAVGTALPGAAQAASERFDADRLLQAPAAGPHAGHGAQPEREAEHDHHH